MPVRQKVTIALILLLFSFHSRELHGEKFNNPLISIPLELNAAALSAGMKGLEVLSASQQIQNDSILVLIDFSLPSWQERLFIYNVNTMQLIKKSLVAHGVASGEIMATKFSNIKSSHTSSLGFFITGETYSGKHGYSLRLHGIEKGINSNAYQRALVIHGASYVSKKYIEKNGRLGRSFGCPALSLEDNKPVIDMIKSGTCLFIYAPDDEYFSTSEILF
jgi:hypothetical protein